MGLWLKFEIEWRIQLVMKPLNGRKDVEGDLKYIRDDMIRKNVRI